MRPHPIVSGLLIIILVAGLLLSLSFFSKDGGTGIYRQQAILTLIITAILCLFLLVVATAKFWYKHLWRKNSSHARHKQHTKHHPAYQKKKSDHNHPHNKRR